MKKIAAEDDRVVALTAAMPDGTGLTPLPGNSPRAFSTWESPNSTG